MITLAEFRSFAREYAVIPLVRHAIADYETPISLAAKLQQQGRSFLLESIEGGETWGRYSILGFDIRKEFLIVDGQPLLRTAAGDQPLSGPPVAALQTYLAARRAWQPPGLPRFFGGAVGYFNFDAVRFFERCGAVPPNTSGFPDAHFFLADHLAVFDNLQHTMKLVCCVQPAEHASVDAAYEAGCAALDRMAALLAAPAPVPRLPPPTHQPSPVLTSNMARAEYEAMVAKAQRYIVDGDIIQVVLAQRFTTPLTVPPFDIYRALRYVNPSPYMYFLDFGGGRAIAGSSPEVMVRVTDRVAEVRPIAGTRPRHADPAKDEQHARDLLADPKERAEHVMLVDLARNDLGRVAEIGSVVVSDYMTIERYSHVMHLVSHVQATLRPECDALDVFQATFPAGTLSGAPKVRAMQIIHELEPLARGPYGGALGYIAYGGRIMDLAITIRTVAIADGVASVTAGAGIVYDSVPATEYEETLHKSNGMRRALALAANGLRLEEGAK